MKSIKRFLFIVTFFVIFGLIGIQKVNAATLPNIVADCYYGYPSSSQGAKVYAELILKAQLQAGTTSTYIYKVGLKVKNGESLLYECNDNSECGNGSTDTFSVSGFGIFTKDDFNENYSKTVCPSSL